MARISIWISDRERDALVQLAERELRDPRQQAVIIIRQALEQCGLLAAPTQAEPDQVVALREPAGEHAAA